MSENDMAYFQGASELFRIYSEIYCSIIHVAYRWLKCSLFKGALCEVLMFNQSFSD